MGCSQSKIENEEAVARCKERKRFMKEAVSTRNAFAASHSAYTTSLKNTGAALGDFAHGEVQNPQLPTAPDNSYIPAPPQQPPFEIPPPPPPVPDFSPGPLQRAVSMPEIKITKPDPRFRPTPNPILEEEEEEDNEGSLRKRRSNRNNTAGGGGGGGGGSVGGGVNSRRLVEEQDAPPPPPPVKQPERDPVHQFHTHHHTMSNPQQSSAWGDYFFPSMENIAGTTLNEVEEDTLHKVDMKVFDHKPNKVDVVVDEVVTSQKDADVPLPRPEPEHIHDEHEEMMGSPVPEHLHDQHEEMMASPEPPSMMKQTTHPPAVEAKRMVKHNVNFLQVFDKLDDHFLKASESAHGVSKMLEATRLHYHSNFADNRGIVLHTFIAFFFYGLQKYEN